MTSNRPDPLDWITWFGVLLMVVGAFFLDWRIGLLVTGFIFWMDAR